MLVLILSVIQISCSNKSSFLKKDLPTMKIPLNEESAKSLENDAQTVINKEEIRSTINDIEKNEKGESKEIVQDISREQSKEQIEKERVDVNQVKSSIQVSTNKAMVRLKNAEKLISPNKKYESFVSRGGNLVIVDTTKNIDAKDRFVVCSKRRKNLPMFAGWYSAVLDFKGSNPYITIRSDQNNNSPIIDEISTTKNNPRYPVVLRITDSGVLEIRDSPSTSQVGNGDQLWSCKMSSGRNGLVSAKGLTISNTLIGGLTNRDRLISDENNYTLILNKNGTLNLMDGSTSIWSTKEADLWGHTKKDKFGYVGVLQEDGNFVIYYRNTDINSKDTSQTAVWETKTYQNNQPNQNSVKKYTFILQNDRNLVVYDNDFTALWATGSNK